MTGGRRMRILHIGGFPPPYGGVTVYVKRLFDYLKRQGHDCHVYDHLYPHLKNPGEALPEGVRVMPGKWSVFWRILVDKSYDIIHISEFSWKQRSVMVLLARLKKSRSIITLHSLRDDFQAMSLLNRIAVRLTIRMVDFLVSSGRNEAERLGELFPVSKLRVITPFVPPMLTTDEVELPEEIRSFCARHTYNICANGSDLSMYHDKDIYGLDMLVEGCKIIRENWDAAIIYCLSGIENVQNLQHLHSYQERIKRLGLEDHFLIYRGVVEFWKVISQCDMFVRPSRADSFGISVAESIYLRKPVIASDVCPRPDGTIVFPVGNIHKMVEAISTMLDGMASGTWDFNPDPPEDGSVLLESIYYELVEGQRSDT